MIGLGDPERTVVDCAGDQWYVSGAGGAMRTLAAPSSMYEFVAPAQVIQRWSQWLMEVLALEGSAREWMILAPSVFGSPRRGLVAAAAAAIGVSAEVIPRAQALVGAAGLLYCRRALVLECRGEHTQAHVFELVDDRWCAVRAASDPDPVLAARALFDEQIDQALVDGTPEQYGAVREALAQAGLWRVVATDPAQVLPTVANQPTEPDLGGDGPVESSEPGGRMRPVLAGAAVLAVGAVAAGAVACLPARAPASEPERREFAAESFVEVAFGGTVVDLPSGWTVSEPAPDRRAAQATDGRRVTVVHKNLHAPSDQVRVGRELQAALASRNDRRITDLDTAAVVAGRHVIGYRERLDAQRFVDWYVVVTGAVQLSVGCEAGRTAAPLAPSCERAVRSVRMD